MEHKPNSISGMARKDIMRIKFTLDVAGLANLCSFLEQSIKFKKVGQGNLMNDYYVFMGAFNGIFKDSFMYCKSPELVEEIDNALNEDWVTKKSKDILEKAKKYTELFRKYQIQLVNDGLISIEWTSELKKREEAFQESI